MAAARILPRAKFRLWDDGKYVSTTLPVRVGGWAMPMPARLDSASIDALLAGLGRMRGGMADQHPLQLTSGVPVSFVPDPRWLVSRSSLTGGPCLTIRHPGFGWIQVELTTYETTRLAQDLLAAVGASAQTP